ncbi:MAG: 3-dehydroquinate synthase [Phycisphaera sp.]|nr:3-dehydroquinate synthase [Phycisphaera sp.]
MPTVQLKLEHHRYDIRVERGALKKLGQWVSEVAPHARCGLLCDENVKPLHGPAAELSLKSAGFSPVTLTVAQGEAGKSLDTYALLQSKLVQAHLERKSPVIALGGGVTGDTAGFVAATYLRGVPFVQCPTTLLAMVDASVGGKVGVNLPEGKNLVGAFHQPVLVVIDTDTLATLPPRELRCGLAECVKHAVIRDPRKLDWLEEHLDKILALDPDALVELVTWNVQIKANVVMADEKETGERAHLNFGHTFAHAIEATQGYDSAAAYHHGEAVALGMVAATRLAIDTGVCGDAQLIDRLVNILKRIGLPTGKAPLKPTPELMASMQLDKKVAGGKIRLVLPTHTGGVTIRSDIPLDAIAAAWDSMR